MTPRSGVTHALMSDLGGIMADAVHMEFIAKTWGYPQGYIGHDWLSEAQMRQKRNRLRKSWPELAQLLDEATRANIMDGVEPE